MREQFEKRREEHRRMARPDGMVDLGDLVE
jgi:hypothetical protein